MDFLTIALVILFFVILSVPVANRFGLPLEVFLVIGSCLISLIPGLPLITINPHLIFNLFLPPILFYAAYFTSVHRFKSELRAISLLAIGLVLCTMLVVAIVVHWIFPHFSWAEGLVLGAIVSPTDAVSSTTIIKKFNAPSRLLSILDGENLINDATALVLLRFALAGMVGEFFTVPEAILQFVIATAGGAGIGLLSAKVFIYIIERMHSIAAEITLTFLAPLAIYLVAEHLHCSGVIATVVCGIYFGTYFPAHLPSRNRVYAKASWDTLMFIINGFVFTLIGFYLPDVLKNLAPRSLGWLIIDGLLVSLAIMSTRMAWVFAVSSLARLIKPSIRLSDPKPLWPLLFIMGWCGMRGIVSLAAALSLPVFIEPSIYFAHRNLIIFITFCVIVTTLITPAFTLPFLLRKLGLHDVENKMKQETAARLRSLEGVARDLQVQMENTSLSPDILNILKAFHRQIEQRIRVIKTQQEAAPYSTLDQEYETSRRLMLAAIRSERNTLLALRKSGEISEEIFQMLLEELDIEEMRTKTLRV